MSQESELIRLEKFVSKLLQNYRELKEENGRLIEELQMRDETIVSLKEDLAVYDLERNEISNRVSGIIGKIEEWETTIGEETRLEVPINDPSRQGSLFSSADVETAGSKPDGSRYEDF